MSDPQIFVDDSDPQITYGGDWKLLQGLTNAHFSGSSRAISPLYGTVHTSSGNGSTLEYSFTGSAFRAIFHTEQATFACVVDDNIQQISPTDSGVQCSNEALDAGTHKVLISVADGSISLPFDGIFYTPLDTPAADLDVMYNGTNPIIQKSFQNPQYMQALGDTLEVDFVGHSLSVYSAFFDGSVANSPVPHNSALSFMSYTLDDGLPINFTISNPTNAANPEIDSQLIVQTPHLPTVGAHRFSMTLMGAAGTDNVVITVASIIVQNATLPLVPDAFPAAPMPSQAATSQLPTTSAPSAPFGSSTKKSSAILPAVLVPVFVVLTISIFLFYLWRRRRQLSHEETEAPKDDSAVMTEVQPYQAPYQLYTENRASISKLSPLRRRTSTDNHSSDQGDQRPRRYRYHSDGGVVLNPAEYSLENETVDVPPLYGSFKSGPLQEGSNASSGNVNDTSGSSVMQTTSLSK